MSSERSGKLWVGEGCWFFALLLINTAEWIIALQIHQKSEKGQRNNRPARKHLSEQSDWLLVWIGPWTFSLIFHSANSRNKLIYKWKICKCGDLWCLSSNSKQGVRSDDSKPNLPIRPAENVQVSRYSPWERHNHLPPTPVNKPKSLQFTSIHFWWQTNSIFVCLLRFWGGVLCWTVGFVLSTDSLLAGGLRAFSRKISSYLCGFPMFVLLCCTLV